MDRLLCASVAQGLFVLVLVFLAGLCLGMGVLVKLKIVDWHAQGPHGGT